MIFSPKQISIQALYDYKSANAKKTIPGAIFQFKHCTIIRLNYIGDTLVDVVLFQFKHCTIIRDVYNLNVLPFNISIQALYDYKPSPVIVLPHSFLISIQALYDYKDDDYRDTVSMFNFNSSIVRL